MTAIAYPGRFARLDPYEGARLALAEAYRNVAATGATPVAVTNCLNFGSPEDPAVMWQFEQAVKGLADGCVELSVEWGLQGEIRVEGYTPCTEQADCPDGQTCDYTLEICS